MHQSHNIPWHILASNIKHVHDYNKVTPPYSGLMFLDRPTQSGEISHFTRKLISTIHTFAITERQKYPPAQEFQTPPDDTLVFSDELMAKYPRYLNEGNQKLKTWARTQNYTGSQWWILSEYGLADVVGVLLHENQMHSLLMLANHPSVDLRILDYVSTQSAPPSGFHNVALEALIAYFLWNFVDAAGYFSSGAYKDMKTMKDLVKRQTRPRHDSTCQLPHQEFYACIISAEHTATPGFDEKMEYETPDVCGKEGAERLHAYLKHLFELLYRYEVLATECGLDRGADWENKLVDWAFHLMMSGRLLAV